MIEWVTMVAAVAAAVFSWLMYRAARLRQQRTRPYGMPGEWVERYKGRNIFARHTYFHLPDIGLKTDPLGSDEFYVEHGSRGYHNSDDAKAAIRAGSWMRMEGKQ